MNVDKITISEKDAKFLLTAEIKCVLVIEFFFKIPGTISQTDIQNFAEKKTTKISFDDDYFISFENNLFIIDLPSLYISLIFNNNPNEFYKNIISFLNYYGYVNQNTIEDIELIIDDIYILYLGCCENNNPLTNKTSNKMVTIKNTDITNEQEIVLMNQFEFPYIFCKIIKKNGSKIYAEIFSPIFVYKTVEIVNDCKQKLMTIFENSKNSLGVCYVPIKQSFRFEKPRYNNGKIIMGLTNYTIKI